MVGIVVNLFHSIPAETLPLAITLLPLGGAVLTLVLYRKPWVHSTITVATTLGMMILAVMLIPHVLHAPIEIEFSQLLALGMYFRVDALGLIFLVLFAFISLMVAIYSTGYICCEHSQCRFFAFFLLTISGVFGVIVAGDFFTLLLFFELMTLSSYVLVIHRQGRDTLRAGYTYLFFGIVAGLALLLALILVYSHAGKLAFQPSLAALEQSGYLVPVLVLFTVGFGIKAGLMPLHIWMPGAYAVSPSPVNAISSGLMLKTGAYGLVRLYVSTLTYSGAQSLYNGMIINAGLVLFWLGIFTMLAGAVLALLQRNVFRTLAYSSISQVGYIIMGLGVAVHMGSYGAMGLAGALYHTINHSLFKVALFCVIGALYVRLRDLRLTRLGGLKNQYPFLMIIFIIAGLGLVGMPGFSGYGSKTILHHAIVEIYEHHNSMAFWISERIFTLASAITVCYFTKIFSGIFLGQLKQPPQFLPKVTWPLRMPLAGLSVAMLGLGLRPHLLVRGPLLNLLSSLGYSTGAIHHVAEVNLWSSADLMSAGRIFLLAAVIYVLQSAMDLENRRFPAWLSVEHLAYKPAVRAASYAVVAPGLLFESIIYGLYRLLLSQRTSQPHDEGSRDVDQGSHPGDRILAWLRKKGRQIEKGSHSTPWEKLQLKIHHSTREPEVDPVDSEQGCDCRCRYRLLRVEHPPRANGQEGLTALDRIRRFCNGESMESEWDLCNMNFDALIIVTMITVLLVLLTVL